MERLHQTHDSLRAYRPAGGAESILGRTTITEGPDGVVEETAATESERPWWLTLVNTGRIPEGSYVSDMVLVQPRWPSDGLAGEDPAPLDYVRNPRRPVNVFEMYDCGFASAQAVGLDLAAAKSHEEATAAGELVPMDVLLGVSMEPVSRLGLEIIPEAYEIEVEAEVEPEDIPPYASLQALSRAMAREAPVSESRQPIPVEIGLRAQLPLDAVMRHATLAPAALLEAGLRQLPMDRVALAPAPWVDTLRALDLRAAETPLFTLSTPPARPRLRLASGRRYAVETRPGAAPAMAPDTGALATKAPGISLPKRDVDVIRAASAPVHEPEPAGMLPLAKIAQPSAPAIEMRPAPEALTIPQPPRTEPVRPMSKLEPMNPRPAFDLSAAMPPMPPPSVHEPTGHERANVWIHAVDFWKRAPRDLKMLAFAIPMLLGLALHPSLPKVRVSAPAKASGFQKNFQRVVNDAICERAADGAGPRGGRAGRRFPVGAGRLGEPRGCVDRLVLRRDRLCAAGAAGDVPAVHGSDRLSDAVSGNDR